ncbi:MAG: hypothetical protein AAF628_11395 [Planctomycetota bacterium]
MMLATPTLTLRTGEILVRPFAPLSRWPTWIALLAAAGCLCALGVGLALDVPVLAVIAGSLLGLAVAFALLFLALAARSRAIRWTADAVQVVDRHHPRRNLVAVSLDKTVRTVHTQHGKHDVEIWSVELVTDEIDPAAAAQIDAVRHALEAVLAAGDAVVEPTQLRDMVDTLTRLRPVLAQATLRVPAELDEIDGWQLSEALAARLDVPLIDFTGDEPVERVPAELDLPAGARLLLRGQRPADPGPPPEGMQADQVGDQLRLRWRLTRLGYACGLGLVALLVAWLGYGVYGAEPRWVAPLFWGVAALLLVAACFADSDHGDHELIIDASEARLSLRGGRRHRRINTRLIEVVRVKAREPASLQLVTDTRILASPMTVPYAQWARARIEGFLCDDELRRAGVPRSSEGQA